jgi:xylulokinase
MASQQEEKYILAIDHGTSGAKTAIVSTKGKIMDWVFEEVPLYLGEGGKAEQDPAEWWAAIKKTIKNVIDKGTVPVEDIVGICDTSQWSGTVAVDKDGNNLMNAIIWMDTRGAYLAEQFNKGGIRVSGYNLSKILKFIKISGGGPTLSGKDSIEHIWFIKKELPEIYAKTFKFLEPQDWVNLKFTGKFASSYATIMNHWLTDIRNINKVHYSKPLLRMVKESVDKYPELKLSTDVLGPVLPEVADELGLSRDTMVVMGAPDLHSATVGSGAVRNFEGHLCIGTSDWLLCHVPYKKTDINHNMASLPSAIPGRYLLCFEQECAGANLQFLRNKMFFHQDELLSGEQMPGVYKIFDQIVERVKPGSEGLIYTPWLVGERAPVDNPYIRGGFVNLSLDMDREHIIRAVYEGVAYNVRWAHMYVEKFINKPMDNINAIGGGAQSNIWCQIFADVLGRTIRQVDQPIEANARGAGFIGAVGLGYLNPDDIPNYVTFSNVFKPNKDNKPIYDKLFKEYTFVFDSLKTMYRRLNETKK